MITVYVFIFCIILNTINTLNSADDEVIYVNIESFLSDNTIEFDAFNQHYKVKLTANQHTLGTNKLIETKKKLVTQHVQSDYYFGTVLNCANSSSVALSIGNGRGIRGMISAFGETLMIEPLQHYIHKNKNKNKTKTKNKNEFNYYHITDQHIIFKLSAKPAQKPDKILRVNKRRRLVYNNGDNVVEVYILSDPGMTEYFQDQYTSTQWYNELIYRLENIMNGANAQYVNQDWGNQIGTISLKWVELEVVEAYSGIYASLNPPLNPLGEVDSSAYMRLFQDWLIEHKDPNSFDAAILFTKYDMDSSGIGFIGTICDYGMSSVSVITDRRSLARAIKLTAHEIGHNFGMEHDEPNCPDGHIMGDGDLNTGWSICSVQYMNDWFNNNNGLSCLINNGNKPFRTNYKDVTVPNPVPIPSPIVGQNEIKRCQGSGDCACPMGTVGVCTINCNGNDACKDGNIECNNNGYECIVNCVGNGACAGSASVMGPSNGVLVVNCVGEKSCEGSFVVNGEKGNGLFISCNGDTTCKAAKFYGGYGNNVISCNGKHDTCQDAIFNSIVGFEFECIGEYCPII